VVGSGGGGGIDGRRRRWTQVLVHMICADDLLGNVDRRSWRMCLARRGG